MQFRVQQQSYPPKYSQKRTSWARKLTETNSVNHAIALRAVNNDSSTIGYCEVIVPGSCRRRVVVHLQIIVDESPGVLSQAYVPEPAEEEQTRPAWEEWM